MQTLPTHQVPFLPPPTTPATLHSPDRYHIYRVCAFLPTPTLAGPPTTTPLLASRQQLWQDGPPPGVPRIGVPHPQTP